MSRNKRADERRELFKSLKAGKLALVYYVHGPDAFMLESAIDAIVSAAAPEGLNEFNHDKFRGRDAQGANVRAAAEQLPFMVPRRIVILRNVEEMPNAELEAFSEYFQDPSPTTVLIVHALTANSSLDARLSAVKKLRKAAEEYEFQAFYEDELGEFIARHANDRNLKLTSDANAYLVESIGTELFLVVDALERVDLYLGDSETRREVDLECVRHVVAHTRVHSVFALTEAIGARNTERAFQIFNTMAQTESPIKLAALIARHFRILLKLKDTALRSADRNTLARAVGVAPFFLKDYQRDAERFSRSALVQIHTWLLETDYALKSSKVADRILMEALLFKICSKDALV